MPITKQEIECEECGKLYAFFWNTTKEVMKFCPGCGRKLKEMKEGGTSNVHVSEGNEGKGKT